MKGLDVSVCTCASSDCCDSFPVQPERLKAKGKR